MYRSYFGEVLMVATSATGRGHIKNNLVCQDRVNFFRKNNVSVMALADGAGSEKFSQYGAETAIRAIGDYLAEKFNALYDDIECQCARQAISEYVTTKLSELANKRNIPIKSLASTLIAVAICNGRYIVFHVGDGVIGAFSNGAMRPVSLPENGEFANSTVFMTSSDVEQHIRLFKGTVNDITGFLVMSDGAASSLFDSKNNKFAGAAASVFKIAHVLPSRNLEIFMKRRLMEKLLMRTQDDCSVGFIMKPQKCSRAFKKRCVKFMGNLENGCSVYKSLQKAGVHKKYYRRYISLLTSLGWLG